ncbi:aminoglycoside phosphotransferase family protein [Aspergillus ibericus CBS 121593]|uniref:Altered inheritance of mitochondria protein 9, mitochondrial n=1 Tax=Aspergillus ibericus CBS 121593 TaxID=1448316 RepID=A0A395GMA7_9EURO|nr:phosphotransferase family protein [Aspergillus ibericus CBS 121593]RAK96108.1 phosphotransferase family protein [Aspergillus ibericus CBS 121593]
MSSANLPSSNTDFYRYTSGRWLWEEEERLRERHTPFNVSELQKIAADSVGATKCIAMAKLAEGSCNKAFRLEMNNGSVVIARIPCPIAGPKYYTTASEVATMEFARSVLEIPTPQVYAWSADANNSVGSEYIIMEEAPGTKLDDIWHDIPLEQKVDIVENLISLVKKMASLSFNRYGNLYYASEDIPGAVAAEIMGDVPAEVKDRVKSRFVIGPVVRRDYWRKERAKMPLDRGPWTRPQDFVTSLARREIAWIQQYAVPIPPDDPFATSETQNSPSSHIALLKKYLKVAPYLLPDDPSIIAPRIWHADLHAGNLFVQNSNITSVIDWQEIWAAPLILQSRHPQLVDYDGPIILKAPANFKDLNPEEKNNIRDQMSRSIVLYLYEKKIAKEVPLLHKVLRFNHGRTRCEPILFVSNTWENSIINLRECLIRLERSWDELKLNIPCPIHFTPEEHRLHAEEGEGWNKVQDFWDFVSGFLARDGWTPTDRYDDAVAFFTDLRDIGLKGMVGKEREEFRRQTEWVEKHSHSHSHSHSS